MRDIFENVEFAFKRSGMRMAPLEKWTNVVADATNISKVQQKNIYRYV